MKQCFAWLALSLWPGLLLAQPTPVHIGFRAGLNVASASQSSIDKIKSLIQFPGSDVRLESITGYHAGLVVRIGGPNFSVQPEVLYSQYGARVVSGSNLAELKSNVIEVPVLIKYAFGSRAARFFVNAGPFADYALNGNYTVVAQVGTFPINTAQVVQFDKTSDRLAYGLTGGAGLTWHIGPGDLLAEVRYSYSLQSKVPPSVVLLGGTELHARLGMVSVGYLIPFGR